MTIGWLDEPARRALRDAVLAVERGSAAELVIAVRRRARRWPHVPLIAGIVGGWTALAFMLFSRHVFGLAAILIDPVLVGGAVGLAATLAPWLVRALTPARVRRRAVEAAARATFVERGVHHTRARTGVLVYCALTEGMAVIVADIGVGAAVPAATLAALTVTVDQAVGRGGAATGAAVAALAPVLAAALPRGADDVNELADALDHDLDPDHVRRPRS